MSHRIDVRNRQLLAEIFRSRESRIRSAEDFKNFGRTDAYSSFR
jgi:hypothetical protein